VEIDEKTGKAKNINRIRVPLNERS
jgi:calcineurin-like phosphoesterase